MFVQDTDACTLMLEDIQSTLERAFMQDHLPLLDMPSKGAWASARSTDDNKLYRAKILSML